MSAEHTTAVLLRRLRGGEVAARELLCARLEPQLRRWARGRLPASLRGSADTADLVQTALLRVLGKLERFESAHAGALYGYVRTAMTHVLCDALRAHPQAQRVDFETLAELPQLRRIQRAGDTFERADTSGNLAERQETGAGDARHRVDGQVLALGRILESTLRGGVVRARPKSMVGG